MSMLAFAIAAIVVVAAAHLAIIARTKKQLRRQFERELQAARDDAARKAYTRSSFAWMPLPQTIAEPQQQGRWANEDGTQNLPADTIAAIEASIAAITGKGVHVRAARDEAEPKTDHTRWAGQGRITIQHSHEIVPSGHSRLPSSAHHEITTSEAA
jgi:hypothetical protein